jgi:hypothetical protein
VVTLLVVRYEVWNEVAQGSAGCTKEDTGRVFTIVAALLHLLGLFVTFGYRAFVNEEKDETLTSATKKETLALTTGQAVGQKQPLPSDTNRFVQTIGEFDA